jgi:hypothetical protein
MSEPNAPALPGEAEIPSEHDDQIQFDQAEYSTEAPGERGATCTHCRRPIADSYFEIGGKVVCAMCRQRIEEAFRGGSKLARGMRALLFGILAAITGAIVYYLFVRLTHTNWALISIVVGLMVGGAVRAGSGNRGGRFYQLSAIFLTYSAIVGMNLPGVIEGLFQRVKQTQVQEVAPANGRVPFQANKNGQPGNSATPKNDATQPDAKAPPTQAKNVGNAAATGAPKTVEKKAGRPTKPEQAEEPPSLVAFFGFIAVMLMIGFVYPVYEAFHAPISGLIYAFALWESWKINKKVRLTFSGPFRVSAAPEGDLPPEVVGDGA